MFSKDSIKDTLIVALLLCLVCSIIVSVAAVVLKPAQIANKAKDFKINILRAGGLYDQGIIDGRSINEMFETATTKWFTLVPVNISVAYESEPYDQHSPCNYYKFSHTLNPTLDLHNISRSAHFIEDCILTDKYN